MATHRSRLNYTLTEAFEHVGDLLYGKDWSGHELLMTPRQDPTDFKQERLNTFTSLEEIDRTISELERFNRSTNGGSEAGQGESTLSELQAESALLQAKYSELPDADDGYEKKFKIYQRKLNAEKLLITALANGEIKAQVLGGPVIPKALWKGKDYFRYSLQLNLVRLPRDITSKRHQSARIPIGKFQEWLRLLKPFATPVDKKYLSETRCREFLREVSAEGVQRHKKDKYYCLAKEWGIPDLARTTFNDVWKEEGLLPDSWKLPGRRIGLD